MTIGFGPQHSSLAERSCTLQGTHPHLPEVFVNRKTLSCVLILFVISIGAATVSAADAAQPDPVPASIANPTSIDTLLNLMVSKGILTQGEVASLRLQPGNQVAPLLALLA